MSERAPFDTHQRLTLCRRILEEVLEADGSTRVLDVGGYPGLLAEAVGNDARVYTIDRLVGPLPRYVRGDTSRLPVRSGSFDAVVCNDVLEHLEPDARAKTLKELSVALKPQGWLLLGAPFDTPGVARAERVVRDLQRRLRHSTAQWLEEHARNGLPNLKDTEEALRDHGFHSRRAPNGSLEDWLLLKGIEVLLHALPNAFDLFAEINERYLEHWTAAPHRPPVYRHLIVAHRQPEALETLDAPLSGLNATPSDGADTDRVEAIASILEKLGERLAAAGGAKSNAEAGYVARLERIVETAESEKQRLQTEIDALRARLAPYESSRLIALWRRLRWR